MPALKLVPHSVLAGSLRWSGLFRLFEEEPVEADRRQLSGTGADLSGCGCSPPGGGGP